MYLIRFLGVICTDTPSSHQATMPIKFLATKTVDFDICSNTPYSLYNVGLSLGLVRGFAFPQECRKCKLALNSQENKIVSI